jgi:hypothetical protein
MSFRIRSASDLPLIPGTEPLVFNWHVRTRSQGAGTGYISVISLSNGTVILEEECFSCDGKYFSSGDNHYQEVVKWMKERYGTRFSSITRTYQDFDCGCYFED